MINQLNDLFSVKRRVYCIGTFLKECNKSFSNKASSVTLGTENSAMNSEYPIISRFNISSLDLKSEDNFIRRAVVKATFHCRSRGNSFQIFLENILIYHS